VISVDHRLAVQDFLVHEARLLDHRHFEDWLALWTDDATYFVPVRVSRKMPAPDVVDDIGLFDDTKQSLTLRVRRLGTDVAWAEDPPSFTRRFVTNFDIEPEDDGEVRVRDYLLLYRSRGDGGVYDLISGEREHRLRVDDGHFQIAHRRVVIDQASLGTKNLGVFL
jgi:3-phenylpropionate/cinnamic acid dioxygenase small subunit